jgi:hypothetical protein
MPLWDRIRLEALAQVAALHFGPIHQSELQVLAHSASGAELDVADDTTPRPAIRPDFIRWLATDPEAAPYIDSRGIRLWSVTIPGKLDLIACRIPHQLSFLSCDIQGGIWAVTADLRGLYLIGGKSSNGIIADAISLHGPLFVKNHIANGPLSFIGSVIERNVDFTGTKLLFSGTDPVPNDRAALTFDGATFQGSVFLHHGFESAGHVRMLNARVRGDFGCGGAHLTGAGKALSLDKLVVEGNASFIEGFTSAGSINLPGAQIVGDLDFAGATLKAKGIALNLASATIRGNVYLREGFRCAGEVCAHSAVIGRSFDCGGATITDTITAVRLEKATVHGSVIFCEGFNTTGRVELPGSQLDGDLVCDDAALLALYCLNMRLEGDLHWTGIRNSNKTVLCLNGARIGTLRDERESWPVKNGLRIDGLIYQELTLHEQKTDKDRAMGSLGKEHELRAIDRIEWLRLQPEYEVREAQPWMQLVALLRAKGDDRQAKRVILEMRKTQARACSIPLRWWEVVLAQLERQPLWILLSIFLLTALGWFVFWQAAYAGAMAPTESVAYSEWHKGAVLAASCPPFNPFIYSLENNLPLIKLGQDDKWAPDWSFTPKRWFTNYQFLAGFRWFLILAGWAQATILAAALTNRFKT